MSELFTLDTLQEFFAKRPKGAKLQYLDLGTRNNWITTKVAPSIGDHSEIWRWETQSKPVAPQMVYTSDLRIAELTAEVKCYCELQDKLSVILTNTANALKGKPAELSVHSWHDLAEVATEVMVQLKTARRDGIMEMLEAVKVRDNHLAWEFVLVDDIKTYASSLTGEE